MKDQVIKGTGNSRFLRSSISASATLADIILLLRNGEFPIDFNGFNSEGIETVGTDLNTFNLLKDATCTALGLSTDAVPDDAINALLRLINSAGQDLRNEATARTTADTALQTNINTLSGNISSSYVPNTRKVANKALSSDITLTKSDVGLGKVNNNSITMSLSGSTLNITYS